MPGVNSTVDPIKYKRGCLQLLNQRNLPMRTEYEDSSTVDITWTAIREMKVRGAPAIAVAAMLGLGAELANVVDKKTFTPGYTSVKETVETITKKLDYLETSRPTAVNLFNSVRDAKAVLSALAGAEGATVESVLNGVVDFAEKVFAKDTEDCMAMGENGCKFIKEHCRKGDEKVRILTHCNAGALATSKFGTALSVMRYVHADGVLAEGFCTETRPYNQGARLTAYELVTEGIQTTLVCDSSVAYLMKAKELNAVVLGADRVCRNGDTANKIGTYQISLSAKAHGVPFIVVAPTTTFDLNLLKGEDIVIEQRSSTEVTHNPQTGERVVVEGDNFNVWNPAFDVTPAANITAIVTERGVVTPNADGGKGYDLKLWLDALNK